MKEKATWLLLGLAIALGIAVTVARSAFDQRRLEAQKLIREIDARLLEVYPSMLGQLRSEFTVEAQKNPTYLAYEKENGRPYDLPGFPYSAPGNSSVWGPGGFIDGPVFYSRSIILDMSDPKSDFSIRPRTHFLQKAHLEVNLKADWRFFPGSLHFTISKRDKSKDSQDLLDLLLSELDKRGLHPSVDKS